MLVRSSTAEAFLKKVDPTYAVILCGIDNKYGHPHRETMAKLQGIEVHRSDECGDIIFKSTGNGVVTSCNVGSYIPGSDKELNTTNSSNTSSNADASYEADANTELEKKEPVVGSTEVVYWTPNGKSYHTTESCSTLSRSKTILSGTISESGKFDPCDKCH